MALGNEETRGHPGQRHKSPAQMVWRAMEEQSRTWNRVPGPLPGEEKQVFSPMAGKEEGEA